MKSDKTMKLLMLANAVFLGIIALRPYVSIRDAHARGGGGKFAHWVNISGNPTVVFDRETGEIFQCTIGEDKSVCESQGYFRIK